jgi:hypothetical protein
MGLSHSSISYGGGWDEYGDETCPMGSGGWGDYPVGHKVYLGWLKRDEVQVIRKSGIYRVYAVNGEVAESEDPDPSVGHGKVRGIFVEKDAVPGVDTGSWARLRDKESSSNDEWFTFEYRPEGMRSDSSNPYDFDNGLLVKTFQRRALWGFYSSGVQIVPGAKSFAVHPRLQGSGGEKWVKCGLTG